jgi:hypothetical protein
MLYRWKLQGPPITVDGLQDGVSVQPFPLSLNNNNFGQRWRTDDVADALVDFLHSYNWTASKGWAPNRPDSIPAGAVRIQVGMYPATSYISPPGFADINRVISKNESDRKARQKEADRKYLENFPPNSRKEEERPLQEDRKAEARYSNPCQPLAPQ